MGSEMCIRDRTKVLDKICKTLDCQIHDIVDYVPDDDDVQEK